MTHLNRDSEEYLHFIAVARAWRGGHNFYAMNKVISGYFDSAHRGLQRQQQGDRISGSGSAVQLPPLRHEESSNELSKEVHSKSFGSLVEFTSEQVQMGVQYDKYQQVLQGNAKLMKQLRDIQEQLAITSAKKEAFRAQSYLRVQEETLYMVPPGGGHLTGDMTVMRTSRTCKVLCASSKGFSFRHWHRSGQAPSLHHRDLGGFSPWLGDVRMPPAPEA
eukprot:g22583.t1